MAITKLTMDSIREPGPDNTLMGKVNECVGVCNNLTGDGTPGAGTFTTVSVDDKVVATREVGTDFDAIGSVAGGLAGLNTRDSTPMAAGVGGAIVFNYQYTEAGAYTNAAAAIKAEKTNGTNGNYSTDLVFGTSEHPAAIAERVRITDTGVFKALGEVEIDGALNHDGDEVGFYGTAPIAKQTGVAVTAEAIHAALVALGLIGA